MKDRSDYEYRGAKTMVRLHEQQMRKFLETWRLAKEAGVSLPKTDDSDYSSLSHLLRHVCRAARGYLVWMCEVLELPDPEIDPTPEANGIEREAENYIDHLLAQWRDPLADVPEKLFYKPEYLSRWKVKYCIDAMLEHAVMHPIRHQFQLTRLMIRE